MKRVDGVAKRKPLSRERYEKRNPTVSARVSLETRDRLYEALAGLGMTLSDALRALAGELEVKAMPTDEARQLGYEQAKKVYSVVYPCSVCHRPISIASPKAKEFAGKYMTEHGWGHTECIDRT